MEDYVIAVVLSVVACWALKAATVKPPLFYCEQRPMTVHRGLYQIAYRNVPFMSKFQAMQTWQRCRPDYSAEQGRPGVSAGKS